MKKKLISILLVMALVLSLFACLVSCDKSKGDEESKATSSSSSTETEGGESTEGNTENNSENASGNESDSESESETDDEPKCVHPYDATLEGHWKPACDVCGKPEGKVQDHQYEPMIEDEGDLWLYSFVCTVCDFAASEQEVPYEINSFYSAGELTTLEASGALKGSVGFGAGIGYAKFSAEKGGSVTVKVLSNAEATFPSGSYLVMKVRLGASQTGFSAGIQSSSADAVYTMNFTGLKSGWATIIVDITKAVFNTTDKSGNPIVQGYTPDAFDNYYLKNFTLSGKAGAGESFDVSYVMFCDTLKDAETFVEGDMNVYLYKDIVNESPDADEKVCVDENGNPIEHKYVGTESGHTLLEGCTQCGLEAVEDEPHNFVQLEIDGVLTYACSACKWSRFGEGVNVNKYFTAQDINSMATTYYQITQHGVTESVGINYASFSGKGNTAQVIFSRDNSVSSDIEKAAAFNVGKANLFIIRMKTNTPAVDFSISFRTAVDGATEKRISFPLAETAADEWATYVVDLSTVIPGTYIPDENGNYKLGTFYYHIGYKDFTADVRYDIEFMAFVDEWDEVKAIVSDETVINVTGSGTGLPVNTADRSCVGEHAYNTVKTAEGWKLVCASCGMLGKDFGVGASIEKYMPAEILKNVRTDSDGKIDLEFMEEEGESFIRLSNLIPNGAGWMGLTFVSGEANVTGQYMIMKVRLGENGLGTKYMQMYTGTTVGLKGEGQSASFMMVEDGEWHYVVIDLVACMGDSDTYLVPNADGSYTVKYLQIRPFAGTQCNYPKGEDGKYPQRVMEDDYLDIGFIAYCDSMDDFKDIIAADSYEWSVSIGESTIRDTLDHSCVTHSVSLEITGNTQKAICDFCKSVMRDFTVPEEINWYATYSDAGRYQATVAKEMFDETDNLVFNRYTGSEGGHLNITGGSSSGAATADEYEIGKYLVIKYRGEGAQMLLRVGSKNESGCYNSIGGSYQNDMPGDEWRVAVVSLENVEVFKNDDDGKSTVYVMITTALAKDVSSYTVDIAYVAMVDSIDEMKLLLEEGEGYVDYGTDFSGVGVKYDGNGEVVTE